MTVVERDLAHAGLPERTVHVLRGGGVGLVLATRPDGLPEVLHWGRDTGVVSASDAEDLVLAQDRAVSPSAYDAAWPLTLLPTEHDGWEGRPGIAGQVGGRPLVPAWRDVTVSETAGALVVDAVSDELTLSIVLALDAAGVLRVGQTVTNTGVEDVELAALEAVLPVGDRAAEVLDLAGKWTRERTPQRRTLTDGVHVRESRRGRTGHDAPTLTILGTTGFDDALGELWAVHPAWSADTVHRIDRLAEARTLLGAGELLRAGEVVLRPAEVFTAPETVFVWSDGGLDGLSARLHDSLRARPGHPVSPRPVVLNTWEAVYFRQELEPLLDLARAAADVGVERFVLDDGWFTGRRSDTTSLGDWTVDAEVWPDGLGPLVDGVRALGWTSGSGSSRSASARCPPWPRHTRTGSCRTPTRRGPGGTSTRSTSRNRTSARTCWTGCPP